MQEEKQQHISEQGTRDSITWTFDDIRIGHAVSKFNCLTSFQGASDADVVRFHFGLKGDYSFTYKQLNQTYDLIGGHHNIMYSKGFDIEVKNKSLVLETFGI